MANQAGTVWVDVRGDTKGLLGDISDAARKTGGALGSVGKTVLGDIGRATATIATGLTALGTAGAVSLSRIGAEYNTLEQTSRAAFETVLGTAEAAEKMMNDLREFGQSSPFPRQAFIRATQQLLSFGYEAKNIVPTLGAIQDAVASTGGSSQDILEIANVLAKVTSTGKITAVTLNELGIRGIDAAALIGEGMDKSADQIREAITEGALDADKAIATLVEQMGIRFDGAAERVKKTWSGATDRIKGAWRDIGSDLMQPFISKEGGGAAVQWANDVADAMRHLQKTAIPELIDPMVRVGHALSRAASAAGEMVGAIDSVDVRVGLSKVSATVDRVRRDLHGLEGVAVGAGIAIAGIGARSVLGPLGFIVPAISPITGVLGGLVAGSEGGRNALHQLARRASGFARETAPELLRAVGGLAEELSGGLVAVLSEVGGALFDVADQVGPVLAGAIREVGPLAADLATTFGTLLAGAIRDLAPPLGDLIKAGGELASRVLPMIAEAAGTLLPPAVGLLSTGLEIAAGAAELLADNLWLLAPALGVFAGVKIVDTVGRWGGALAGFGEAVGDFRTNFRELRTAGEGIGSALRGAGSQAGGLAGALTGVLNPAVLGVTAAITAGLWVWSRWAEKKRQLKREAEELSKVLLEQGEAVIPSLVRQLSSIAEDRGFTEAFDKTGIAYSRFVDIVSSNVGDMDRARQVFNDHGHSVERLRGALDQVPEGVRPLVAELLELERQGRITGSEFINIIDGLVDLDKQVGVSVDQLRRWGSQFVATFEEMDLEWTDRAAQAMHDFNMASRSNDIEGMRTALAVLREEFPEVADAAGVLVGGLEDTGEAARQAERELGALVDRLEGFLGIERDAAELSRRFNEALHRTTQSFKEHGAGINDSTEAGRANADMIDRMVTAGERFAEQLAKVDRTGVASGRVFNKLTQDLKDLRDQNLITNEEYEELIRLYGLTPDEINTRINLWTAEAERDLEELREEILSTPGITEPEKAVIRALNDPVALARAGREIAAVSRDRTMKITVSAGLTKSAQDLIAQIPGGIGRFGSAPRPRARAKGGPVWPGWWLVGEEGPELMELGPGQTGRVYDADDTRRMLTPPMFGQPTGFEFGEALLREFRALSADIRRMAERPTIGTIEQHGVEPATAPEDFVVALAKGDILVGGR